MKILLSASTQFEIQEYLAAAPLHDFLITGVGTHSAIYELTHQLHGHHYDVVIQAGIAGAFENSGLQLGDVVVVQQDCFGDAGFYDGNHLQSLQDLNLSTEKEWLINPHHDLLKQTHLTLAKGITVSTISSSPAYIRALQKKWEPHVESMEGAALHYVCSKKNIPFIQIRSISNLVGERDKSKWMLEKSIEKLCKTLHELIPFIRKLN